MPGMWDAADSRSGRPGRQLHDQHCPNEGGCSRWRDPVDDYQDDDEEPIPHGELVAARHEAAAAEGDLDDLPF